MNVSIIDIKGIFKYAIRIIIIILTIIILVALLSNFNNKIKVSNDTLITYLNKSMALFSYKKEKTIPSYKPNNLLALELGVLKTVNPNNNSKIAYTEPEIPTTTEEINKPTEDLIQQIEIPKKAETEKVSERNLAESSTNTYNTVKIKNKTQFELTEDILNSDIELNNKQDILLFHTHTCESYTSSEKYPYTMTGNYRTTDNNYNMVRVGEELKTYLEKKGFNVTHNTTCHDYPSYNGSYDRSLETVQNLLTDKTTEIVIDLHRDAVGNGDTYGPTIKVNGERVAQMMFVIGTDGGGLNHPNWRENLKIAIKIQAKANEMYPGLFRPIILTNSRYNQHTARGASIIEVGATANTLEECLLSMQCLANVLEEVMI